MVDSSYCLYRVVPEGMSQVWRRSEVGNHKQRTLNTRVSSGTFEHTSSSSRNVPDRMIRSDLFWYWNKIKMKPTCQDKNLPEFFLEGSGPPLNGIGLRLILHKLTGWLASLDLRKPHISSVRILRHRTVHQDPARLIPLNSGTNTEGSLVPQAPTLKGVRVKESGTHTHTHIHTHTQQHTHWWWWLLLLLSKVV